MEQALRLRETAKILDVSEKHLRRLAAKGQVPGLFKVGGCYRINPEQLRRFIQGSKIDSKPEAAG